MHRPDARGRGSQINPPNRFEAVHHEDDFEHLERTQGANPRG
jgi:hypothetical protein